MDWVYKSVLLDFQEIIGEHSGENLSKIFKKCLNSFEIPYSKVLAVTTDNAGNNSTFMDALERDAATDGINISKNQNFVRCMAHVINLSVQDIMTELKITPSLETDELSQEISDSDVDEACEDFSNTDEEVEVTTNLPIVEKLRKLAKKIRKSTKLRQQLKRLCDLCNKNYLVPIIDVSTRWNSTFSMIIRATKLKVPLRALCVNESSLSGLIITENEWLHLDLLQKLLEKFDRATNLLSMQRHPTISLHLPTLKWLIHSLKIFIQENSGSLAVAANEGLKKLKKYEE